MEIWPAVDWLDGYMVRLEQGQYHAVTRYSDNPLLVFQTRFEQLPRRIHLVDLDGARTGHFTAWRLLEQLSHHGVEVEVGGGFRDQLSIEQALGAGARRVVLGTQLLQDRAWAKELLTHFTPDQLVASLDISMGQAKLEGWTKDGGSAVTLWQNLYQMGYTLCNVTDISRDGTLQGVNVAFWQEIVEHYPGDIGAGGGIRSDQDLVVLQQLGIHRAVIGKGWLSGQIDLSQWEGVF